MATTSPRQQQLWITRQLGSKVSAWRSTPSVGDAQRPPPAAVAAATTAAAVAGRATACNGYNDLHNSRMDAELFSRLRARRMMMEKLEGGSTPTTPPSDATRHQPTSATASTRIAMAPTVAQSVSGLKRPRPRDPRHSYRCTSASFEHLDVVTQQNGDQVAHLQTVLDQTRNELRNARNQLREKSLGFEAMTVLVQHLTRKPTSCGKDRDLHRQLNAATQKIDELNRLCDCMQLESTTTKQQYEVEICHQNAVHRGELQALQQRHNTELQSIARDALEKYEREIKNAHQRTLSALTEQHRSELEVLNREYKQLDADHKERTAEMKKLHKKTVDELTRRLEQSQQCLVERTAQLRRELEERRRRDQLQEPEKHQQQHAGNQLQQQELESLQAVIDMRNQEIHQLRMRNRDMEKQLEDLPSLRDANGKLEQKVENLEAIIDLKADYERELAEKHRTLLRRFDAESRAMKRLSMDNEQLAWRLSQSNLATPSSLGSTPDVFRQLSNDTTPSPCTSPGCPPSGCSSSGSGVLRRQRPKSMVMLGPAAGSCSSDGVVMRKQRPYAGDQSKLKSVSTMRQSDV